MLRYFKFTSDAYNQSHVQIKNILNVVLPQPKDRRNAHHSGTS